MTQDGSVGCFCGIEVKTPKGIQSSAQKDVECQILYSGAYYLLVRSVDELVEDLKELGF